MTVEAAWGKPGWKQAFFPSYMLCQLRFPLWRCHVTFIALCNMESFRKKKATCQKGSFSFHPSIQFLKEEMM